MKNLLEVSTIMFKDKKEWHKVTDEEKSTYFFIFNRYFSKKYPHLSQCLNSKEQDKVLGMNLIYQFMLNQPYPKWFWSKSDKKIGKNLLTEKQELKLLEIWDIKKEDLEFIIKFYPEEFKEELDYFLATEKNNK